MPVVSAHFRSLYTEQQTTAYRVSRDCLEPSTERRRTVLATNGRNSDDKRNRRARNESEQRSNSNARVHSWSSIHSSVVIDDPGLRSAARVGVAVSRIINSSSNFL